MSRLGCNASSLPCHLSSEFLLSFYQHPTWELLSKHSSNLLSQAPGRQARAARATPVGPTAGGAAGAARPGDLLRGGRPGG